MRSLITLILCSCFFPVVQAEEAKIATVIRGTTLYAEPYSDAQVIGSLKAKQQVAITQRKGGWYRVMRDDARGWLRMSHVRFGTHNGDSRNGEGLKQTLRFLSTGRSGADGVTVATGIRGLDAADVANARPNHRAVNKLDSYAVSQRQAAVFAREAGLKSRSLSYIKNKQ